MTNWAYYTIIYRVVRCLGSLTDKTADSDSAVAGSIPARDAKKAKRTLAVRLVFLKSERNRFRFTQKYIMKKFSYAPTDRSLFYKNLF